MQFVVRYLRLQLLAQHARKAQTTEMGCLDWNVGLAVSSAHFLTIVPHLQNEGLLVLALQDDHADDSS